MINTEKLKYSGSINIKVKNGDQILLNRNFHNSGRWPLFKFFSECLAGNFVNAEKLRPKYLHIFGVQGDNVPNINDIEDSTNIQHYANIDNKITLTTFSTNTLPKIETDENNIGSSKIKIQFTIPFSNLNFNLTNKDSSERVINLLCLYSDTGYFNPTDGGEPSAYFFVRKSNDPASEDYTKLGNLIDIDDKYISNTSIYTLVIEWELSIGNYE